MSIPNLPTDVLQYIGTKIDDYDTFINFAEAAPKAARPIAHEKGIEFIQQSSDVNEQMIKTNITLPDERLCDEY